MITSRDRRAGETRAAQAHLRRNEPEVAAAILDRRLDGIGDECLDAVTLCELPAEVDLALAATDAAMARAQRLADLGDATGCRTVTARGAGAYPPAPLPAVLSRLLRCPRPLPAAG